MPKYIIWRHIDFSRWRPQRLNTTSTFPLVDATVFVTSKSTSKPNFVNVHCNKHVILRQSTKFRLNWSTHCGNITSCQFFKMSAAAAEYYFRFRIYVKVYQWTKFRRHIAIDGWDIITSVYQKQTSAILEFYFRFRSGPFSCNLHVIRHQATVFRKNRSTHSGNITSYPFLKMAAATSKYCFRFRICWCRCLQTVKIYKHIKFRRHISIAGWDITTCVYTAWGVCIARTMPWQDVCPSVTRRFWV